MDNLIERKATMAHREKEAALEKAANRLRAALRAEPGAVEAALRLGRIRFTVGDTAEADRILQALVDRTDLKPADAYTARLFLGRILERSGQPQRAEALYREAMGRVPGPQSAELALAHLLSSTQSSRRAASALVRTSVIASADTAGSDPWTDYLVGHYVRGPAIRAVLRREVQE
jgi:lipopolysaccharide biosynthesis regulator YciM